MGIIKLVNKRIGITEDTVKKSYQGKDAIEEMAEIIKTLENENKNNTKNIDELVRRFSLVSFRRINACILKRLYFDEILWEWNKLMKTRRNSL